MLRSSGRDRFSQSGLDLPRATLDRAPRVVVSTSSGFGGSNVSLLLRKIQEPGS